MSRYLDALLRWAREVSHGPNNTPSSQRVAGLLTVTTLQGVFIGASIMLIKRGHAEPFLRLWEANAILCATLLGLVTVSKFGSKGTKKPDGGP